ncbi:hypothetical protein ElyMa_006601500 [Elysia marginata]|uniref:Uncharacterized protein n=1 Tax=Elysia marginata TaxID=1093978 RepID=A0AAV4IHS2_9GAST|nr:hypothetical protein ElyMa_006601500 [Elysia marginata]
MVLAKASVWYENVLKPLRRLTSATTNSFFVGHRQQPRVSSPTRTKQSEESKADGSPVQAGVFTGYARQHPGQQHQEQTWRKFLKNPLDVMLSNPEHSANMISQRINKPFSTSVVDQARSSKPEKQTPRPFIDRPARRACGTAKQVLKPSARQKEFGSKKYRKYFRDKVMRRGPNSKLQRRNRLCVQSYQENSNTSLNLSEDCSKSLALPTLEKVGFDDPVELPAGKCAIASVLSKETSDFNDGIGSYKDGGSLGMAEKKEHQTPVSCGPGEKQTSESASISMSPSIKQADLSSMTYAPVVAPLKSLCETKPKSAVEKESCCKDKKHTYSSGSRKKTTSSNMRENLQAAAEGFKCSLWKRAVSGDTVFRSPFRLAYSTPCCTYASYSTYTQCCASAKLY